MKSRIMYIENKSAGLAGGDARIGRVTFSKSGSTIYYREKIFRSLNGRGTAKSNYVDEENGEQYWISGPRKDGQDRLYGERVKIEIDDDVVNDYWIKIRNQPKNVALTTRV